MKFVTRLTSYGMADTGRLAATPPPTSDSQPGRMEMLMLMVAPSRMNTQMGTMLSKNLAGGLTTHPPLVTCTYVGRVAVFGSFAALFGSVPVVGFEVAGIGSVPLRGAAAVACCGGFGGRPGAGGCAGAIRSSRSVKAGFSLSTLTVSVLFPH